MWKVERNLVVPFPSPEMPPSMSWSSPELRLLLLCSPLSD
jgi:hypothetical protein